METQMKTLTKAFLGAALLAGSVVAASAPASAQPAYRGDGVYGREYEGRYDERYNRGGGAWRNTSMCTSPRFGRWRFDPVMQRRVFVPHRWAVRGGYLRNCMYTMNRYGGAGVWYR
jgi:hypothetical protein